MLIGCIGIASLALANETHNSHPADGDPLLMLNFKTAGFSFTEVEVREHTAGTTEAWSLKGFLARHGANEPIPFAVVLTRESVTRANQQWNLGDENPNILAVLKQGRAVTRYDLEPVDAPERTVLIEDVNDGMSGQVRWSHSFDKRFAELMPGTRSPGHASASLANAFFTHIEFPEQVEREDNRAPSIVECFEGAERLCVRTRRDGSKAICIELFRWTSDGACSFSCRTYPDCFEQNANG